MRRSLAGALLALMLAAALICPAWGEDFRPLLENRPLTAGDSVSDWLAVASGRAGLQRPDYLRDLESYVTSMYRENGGLDRIKATEWHRITLAVLAQGGDPTAFGRDREGKPIDLVAEGTYNWSRSRSLGAQGLNGWIFALITLDSGGFAVPEGAVYTREDMRRAILSAQTEEGAFGLSAGTADVDITAMALQALGYEHINASCVCGAEQVNPKVQSTVDADALAHMTDRWAKYNMDVCGPVALDLAVSEEACHHKHYIAPGAGKADILLVPNYEVGNGIGKAANLFGSAKNAGIILGAKVPIVLVSRADSAYSKLASIALGSVLSSRMKLA